MVLPIVKSARDIAELIDLADEYHVDARTVVRQGKSQSLHATNTNLAVDPELTLRVDDLTALDAIDRGR